MEKHIKTSWKYHYFTSLEPKYYHTCFMFQNSINDWQKFRIFNVMYLKVIYEDVIVNGNIGIIVNYPIKHVRKYLAWLWTIWYVITLHNKAICSVLLQCALW